MFLIAGFIYFVMLRRQKNKYPFETVATISSCRTYKLKTGADTSIYQAMILDFTVGNKNYKVRQDIGREMIGTRTPSLPYSVGQQVEIFYNPKNPEEMTVKTGNSRKVLAIMWRVFLYGGLIGLLGGIYLTFYYN